MNITGTELLAMARKGRPEIEYRLEIGGGSIAARKDGGWRRVAGKLICDNEWVEMGDLLVNGSRIPFTPDLTQ